MDVVKITGEKQCEIVQKPDPKASGEFAVVKIHSAPMCTEYHAYQSGHVSDQLGHEAAGEVVDVAQSGLVKPGDRVVVMPQFPCGRCALCMLGNYIHCENGVDALAITGNEAGLATYAQYTIKQDWLLIPIPEGMSYDYASMACCGMGPTFGAYQLMNVDAFDTVLVTGMGPVGLGAVVNAMYRGARVIAVETHPFRSELAKKLGAEAVVNPTDKDAVEQVMALTDGLGADKALDTSGTAPAKTFLMDAVRSKGHVAFVGWQGQIDCSTIIRKGLTVHGAWHWNRGDASRILKAVEGSKKLLDIQITNTFPMKDVKKAWDLQLTGNCGKIILHPWE